MITFFFHSNFTYKYQYPTNYPMYSMPIFRLTIGRPKYETLYWYLKQCHRREVVHAYARIDSGER